MCSEVLLFLLICAFTFAETINGRSSKSTKSTFVPELLPGTDCTCVEIRNSFKESTSTSTPGKKCTCDNITKCPSVCRSLRAPETLSYPSYPKKFGLKATTKPSGCKLLPKECGFTVQDRITGGMNATLGAFPWMARIGRFGENRLCGGSLINDRYVLTAAHCVINKINVSIRLGEVEERTDSDCNELECVDSVQEFSSEEIIIHKEYDRGKRLNDIALIRLNRPVNINLYVSPICLPLDHCPGQTYTGKETIAAGWGATGNGGSESRVLQWVNMPVVSHKQCVKVLAKSTTELSDSHICVGGVKGKHTCKGDSGGPVMLLEQNEEDCISRYVLIGVVVFSAAKCGAEGVPTVGAKTSAYTNWIINKLQK